MGVSRRLFLGGLLAGTAAPAIVRAPSLMPIWVPRGLGDELAPVPYLGTVEGLRILLAHQQRVEEMVRMACNPPLVLHIGRIERFTIISTPIERAKLWR